MKSPAVANPRSGPLDAFTLVELLIVMAIIGLLAGMFLPALARTKESSRRAVCIRNLQQIDLALSVYATANQDVLPPPQQAAAYWPVVLQSSYANLQSLLCPTDPSATLNASTLASPNADLATRSYVINSFADYYASLAGVNPAASGLSASSWLLRMKYSAIARQSDTITFGEKASASSAFIVNIFQLPTGSYLSELAENRHNNPTLSSNGGGANFAMADGSVQYLPFGESTCPFNLWAVLDQWRTAEALCRPK